MTYRFFLTICAIAVLAPGLAANPQSNLLDEAMRESVVTLTAEIVKEAYVDAGAGDEISTELTNRKSDYRQRDPVAFAKALTHDLFLLSNDLHLKLKYDPARFAATTAPNTPEGNAKLETYVRLEETFSNFGFERVELLAGNLGYLKLSHFAAGEEAFARADAAFALLADADAFIIDLEGNRGGNSAMVRYLQSYFVDAPMLAMGYRDRGQSDLVDVYTPKQNGPMQTGKLLFILIDGKTASAAEDFAYSMQALGLAYVIGSPSAGAAHTITEYAIEPGFVLTVSTGEPVHPETGSNWAGTGVQPDIDGLGDKSLLRAQIGALVVLRREASPAKKARYGWRLVEVSARFKPSNPSQEILMRFTGKYEAGRISYRNRGLVFEPTSGGSHRLLPLTDSTFAVEGVSDYRIDFVWTMDTMTLLRFYLDRAPDRFIRLHR